MLGSEGGVEWMRRIRSLSSLLIALMALAVVPAAAQAAPKWATVNVCQGNQVGTRTSMPGDGSTARMQARFTLQWWSAVAGGWIPVLGQAQSPWLDAGSARYSWSQVGWTFTLTKIPKGVRTRGRAELRWMKGGQVVRQRILITQGGVGTPVSLASCAPNP